MYADDTISFSAKSVKDLNATLCGEDTCGSKVGMVDIVRYSGM